MENRMVIGKIFVPQASLKGFREQNFTSKFLKQLPGFIKGEAYEKLDEADNLHMVTMTVWANAEAYNNAQRALKEYYESLNFNPLEFRERMKIVFENDVYSIGSY